MAPLDLLAASETLNAVVDPPARFGADIVAAIPRLRAYAAGLAGTRAEADDLVQEALLRAWRGWTTFKPGSNLEGWLFCILRNVFLAQRPKSARLLPDEDGQLAASLSCAPTQEWQVQLREVSKALPKLPHDQREALLLVVAAELSYEEAATICDCGPNAMKQRVHRARESLRVAMTQPRAEPRDERRGRFRQRDSFRPAPLS